MSNEKKIQPEEQELSAEALEQTAGGSFSWGAPNPAASQNGLLPAVQVFQKVDKY